MAGLAIGFAEVTGRGAGRTSCSPARTRSPAWCSTPPAWTVGALLLLVVCKAVAYGLSLSSFRGGPVFPSMFIGAAGGIAASHLAGLSLVPGVAMGIGAMCTVMLKLPLTSTLLATLLLSSDGLSVIPLVIVAVVVAYVADALAAPHPGRPHGLVASERARSTDPAARTRHAPGARRQPGRTGRSSDR